MRIALAYPHPPTQKNIEAESHGWALSLSTLRNSLQASPLTCFGLLDLHGCLHVHTLTHTNEYTYNIGGL